RPRAGDRAARRTPPLLGRSRRHDHHHGAGALGGARRSGGSGRRSRARRGRHGARPPVRGARHRNGAAHGHGVGSGLGSAGRPARELRMSRVDAPAPPWRAGALLLPVALAFGCHRAAPPSRFPTAEAALERMHAAQACSLGVTGEGSLDYFGPRGRVRANMLFLAMLPARVRFDVYSPFGATLSTLTADGERFGLLDLREKVFLRGPANACNIRRFTGVPLPPHALVDLLRGVSPVLVHEPGAATIDWEGGAYVVRIPSRHRAEQEIRFVPPEADYALPWWE